MGDCVSLGLNPGLRVLIYKSQLDYDNDLFVEQIKESGVDSSRNKTNVRALMTKWAMTEYSNVRDLAIDIVVNHLPNLSAPPVDGGTVNWVVDSIWGNVFSKGDHAIPHHHMPGIYSFVYYVKMPKGSSQLKFNELRGQIILEEGDVIIFPAHLLHSAPQHPIEEERVTIAGNIATAWAIEGNYVYESKDIGKH